MGLYWPTEIEQLQDDDALNFVEELLYLIPLGPRWQEFDVLAILALRREGPNGWPLLALTASARSSSAMLQLLARLYMLPLKRKSSCFPVC